MLDMFLAVKPTPKARPRLAKAGHTYTPAKTVKAENDVRLLIKAEMSKRRIQLTHKSVCVSISFRYANSLKLCKTASLFDDEGVLYMPKRPDIDNLAKLLLDAMNGLVYYDDAQVVKLMCEKRYSNDEGIYLKVSEI